MDDALLGADRAVADDDGVEIGSDAKAHALTVTAAFVRSQLIHCRLAALALVILWRHQESERHFEGVVDLIAV